MLGFLAYGWGVLHCVADCVGCAVRSLGFILHKLNSVGRSGGRVDVRQKHEPRARSSEPRAVERRKSTIPPIQLALQAEALHPELTVLDTLVQAVPHITSTETHSNPFILRNWVAGRGAGPRAYGA